MCQFSDFENSEHFRRRNLGSTTVVYYTEFYADYEYQNRLFQFAEMENIWVLVAEEDLTTKKNETNGTV